jgi:hypothetical protein
LALACRSFACPRVGLLGDHVDSHFEQRPVVVVMGPTHDAGSAYALERLGDNVRIVNPGQRPVQISPTEPSPQIEAVPVEAAILQVLVASPM